jgi:hypothetical protein
LPSGPFHFGGSEDSGGSGSFRPPGSSFLHPNQEGQPLLADPPPFLEPVSRPSREGLMSGKRGKRL